MDELLEKLKSIIEALEQVETITDNQTTVLLSSDTLEDEENALNMIEQMADYKDELMNTLNDAELAFQKAYSEKKLTLEGSNRLPCLKEQVARVLELKELIIDKEQKNLLIMQSKAHKKTEKVEIPKSSAKVTAAYQKNTKNPKFYNKR